MLPSFSNGSKLDKYLKSLRYNADVNNPNLARNLIRVVRT